jgi:hypothetical protein
VIGLIAFSGGTGICGLTCLEATGRITIDTTIDTHSGDTRA